MAWIHFCARGLILFKLRSARDTLRSFPSTYQLIPQAHTFMTGPSDEEIDPFLGKNWLAASDQMTLLEQGRTFNEELGNDLSVDTLVFFGRKLPTTTSGHVHFDAGTHWSAIDWLDTDAGDGTVPEVLGNL